MKKWRSRARGESLLDSQACVQHCDGAMCHCVFAVQNDQTTRVHQFTCSSLCSLVSKNPLRHLDTYHSTQRSQSQTKRLETIYLGHKSYVTMKRSSSELTSPSISPSPMSPDDEDVKHNLAKTQPDLSSPNHKRTKPTTGSSYTEHNHETENKPSTKPKTTTTTKTTTKSKTPRTTGGPNGEWTPEKRERLIEMLLAAGIKACNIEELAKEVSAGFRYLGVPLIASPPGRLESLERRLQGGDARSRVWLTLLSSA